jgi:hypothetical protein
MNLWGARLSALAVLCLSTPLLIIAQTNVAIVRGRVTDSTGAVVRSASVRLSSPIARYEQAVETGDDGQFRFVDVPPNTYTLTVESSGFEPSARELVVTSSVAPAVDVQLGVGAVRQEIDVQAEGGLLDRERTAPSFVFDRTFVRDFPTGQPSRSTEQIVATAPGFTLDANGRLHARGVEYQIQYDVDGVPITDTIASTFASSPDPRIFRSVEVTTAYIPAEYGDKLSGIIDVTTKSGLELPGAGSATISGGSFDTVEGSVEYGGHTKRFGYFVSAAGDTTDRFLDPPTLENFNNHGTSAKSFFKLDYQATSRDLLRFSLAFNDERFDVPNLPDQQEEGQGLRRATDDNMQTLAWQHTFSDTLVGNVSLFQRYNAARLTSNQIGGPVLAEQSRHHSTFGAVGALTWLASRNTVKGGFQFKRFPVTESFTLAITDFDELKEREPDLPDDTEDFTLATPFQFRDQASGWEGSLYLQDHVNVTDQLTFDVGVRLDSYHFLVDKTFLSPRLGVAYYVPKTRTVLRSSFSRFMETPALENLLLSSSEEAQVFSPAGEDGEEEARRRGEEGDGEEGEPGPDTRGEPVRPSEETQVDVGVQQQLGDYLRLDADFYYRRLTNPPEITNFLETGIIFPATLARSRSKGIETRLDLAPVRGVSAFVSYTNLHIYGFAPITGGLFLGEAVDLFRRSGQRVNIEEDQRNTVVYQVRYEYRPWRLWAAVLGRHDSGYSVELEPDANDAEFGREFPEQILDRVNFDRGFIKPHSTASVSVGKEIPVNEHLSLTAQFDVQNVTDTFYLITFESVFSGTTVGRPRTYTGKLSFNFR